MSERPTSTVVPDVARARGWLHVDLALTVLLSAFLLFQVQPLISKFILPWFGGSPAVWTTCMLFFQVVLFLGYAYAHLICRLLTMRWQAVVHVALLLTAVCTLPIAPSPAWKPIGTDAPTLRILLLLGASVGLPYFALSSTGPLVQSWFARAFPRRSPYRLYALSNFGSLVALLSYPFFFESRFDVLAHTQWWSVGFALFVLPCAAAALWLRKQQRGAPNVDSTRASEDDGPRPGWRQRALWLGLPACATLMLLATTNHVCQEVAVIPFLWVVPLSLYLLSFIVTFDHERWYARRLFASATVLLVLGVAGMLSLRRFLDRFSLDLGFTHQLVLYFAALFSVCMLCHGELVRRKPSPRHLTEFYLMVSAGGALGGAVVSLLSPAVFKTFFEWKIGLMLSFLLGAVVLAEEVSQSWPRLRGQARWALLVPIAAGAVCVGVLQTTNDDAIDIARNFYGVVSVAVADDEEPQDRFRAMIHGTTVHGRQFLAPDKRRLPIAYYGTGSGIGKALQYFQKLGPVEVGAVGLGVGTLAAYTNPGDQFTFYELNEDVVRLAQKHFTYLSDSTGKTEIVLGDARLSMEREPARQFHILALDAFTGDAPPAHLLTEEAFAVYQKHLRLDGVVAFHITNRRVDLMPVIAGLANRFGYQTVSISSAWDGDKLLFRSDWVLLTKNPAVVAALPGSPPDPSRAVHAPVLWTDHYNNLFALLR
jgi:hypothetical protein